MDELAFIAQNEVPIGYDDNGGQFPFNAEVSHITTGNKCFERDIVNDINFGEAGGWAVNYGLSTGKKGIRTRAA